MTIPYTEPIETSKWVCNDLRGAHGSVTTLWCFLLRSTWTNLSACVVNCTVKGCLFVRRRSPCVLIAFCSLEV